MSIRVKKTQEKNINTSDYWNEKYKTRGGGELSREKRLLELIKLISVPSFPALDFGCAFGHLCNHLYDLGCRPVWGLDISQKAIELAKRNYPHINFKIHNVSEGLPFGEGSFFVVTSTETLEHVDDYLEVMKESIRVLKKGGRFLFTVPFKSIYPEHVWTFGLDGVKDIIHFFGDKGNLREIIDDDGELKSILGWIDK